MEILKEMQEKDEGCELELRLMEAKAIEMEEARAREAAEREEKRYREAVEREERLRERQERRDRETGAREERFLAVIEKYLKNRISKLIICCVCYSCYSRSLVNHK